ncbi:AraC family transcriptional regulator [Streptomyces monomycini]|uniref:AraC family transcriptional regulator n=1 Tax=Streptomyces monomycini TaxID=371720 RepID=UPI00067D6B6B|nr:AraC family transcriptional regulator [Streptomyces monomycini]
MTGPTIAVHHVRAVLSGARRRGVDVVPLLQAARISPLLLADERARVAADRFARLVREVHRATDDEFLGLGPLPSRRGTFAMMGLACLGCPDLGTALERAVRFYGLFPGGPEMTVTVGSPGATVESPGGASGPGSATGPVTATAASPGSTPASTPAPTPAEFSIRTDLRPYPEATFLAESVLIIWHRLSSWLVGRRIPLRHARFAHPAPAHAPEYELLFGCAVRFGAPHTAAAFDARWLAAPVVRDEAALTAMLRRAPADLLSRREYGTTVTERVRHTLVLALRATGPARLPEAAEIAARLAVSPATLRRRLQEEGTSYQRLKDAVRRDAAISSLAAGREPIAELAARLGFSEDTAFHRAFRRWTGTTPGAYRLRPPAAALWGQQS